MQVIGEGDMLHIPIPLASISIRYAILHVICIPLIILQVQISADNRLARCPAKPFQIWYCVEHERFALGKSCRLGCRRQVCGACEMVAGGIGTSKRAPFVSAVLGHVLSSVSVEALPFGTWYSSNDSTTVQVLILALVRRVSALVNGRHEDGIRVVLWPRLGEIGLKLGDVVGADFVDGYQVWSRLIDELAGFRDGFAFLKAFRIAAVANVELQFLEGLGVRAAGAASALGTEG